MKKFLIVCCGLILVLGCARVRVEAPKEAIKLDVSMRLDIYQHIQKDIDSIENMVSKPAENAPVKGQESSLGSFFKSFIGNAYADEGIADDVQSAVVRRKERHSRLIAVEAQGVVGENAAGLVVVKADSLVAQDLVAEENADRQIIYKSLADKNNSSLDEVASLYAKRLQTDAPSGTPIEGKGGWVIKP